MTASPPGVLGAVLRQRCPICRRGPVFRGPIKMYGVCPVCDHKFEREPGYFVGAMYVSYALATPIYLLLVLLLKWRFPDLSDLWAVAAALPLFLPFVPFVFRYARVIWLHLDQAIDPKR